MPKINYDEFIKYLVEHSTNDEFKNALYAQGLYFDNNELKQIEYKPEYKFVKDMSSSTELTDDEDERIRKAILNYLTKMWGNCQDDVCGVNVEDAIVWLEKQGEQMPGDKIESRFHVNEWVVTCPNDVVQIKAVNNGYYTIDNGMEFNMPYVDKYWHKWTIQDAKDGDVLIASDGSIFLFAGIVDCACKYYVALTTDNYVKINKEAKGGYWETSRAVYPATKEQCDLLFTKMKDAGYMWDADKKELKKIEQILVNSTKTCKDEQKSADKIEPRFEIEKGKWYVCNTSRYTDFIVGKAYYCPKNGMLKPNENEMARYVARDCFHIWTIQDAKDGDVLICPKYAGDIIPNIFIFKDVKIKDNDVFCHCSFSKTFMTEGYVANADPINTDFYPATKEQRDLLFTKMNEAGFKWDDDKKELKKIKQMPAWSEEDKNFMYDTLSNLTELKDRYGEGYGNVGNCIKWLKSLKERIGG